MSENLCRECIGLGHAARMAGRVELYAAHLVPLVNSLKASAVDLKISSILDANGARLV